MVEHKTRPNQKELGLGRRVGFWLTFCVIMVLLFSLANSKIRLMQSKENIALLSEKLSVLDGHMLRLHQNLTQARGKQIRAEDILASTKSDLGTAKNELAATKAVLDSARAELQITKDLLEIKETPEENIPQERLEELKAE